MGIDYSGGMIVGASGEHFVMPDDYNGEDYEWIEENGLDRMSLHYDANIECCIIGFKVDDISVSKMDDKWFADIKEKAERFERLTGIPAELIGTQDIW